MSIIIAFAVKPSLSNSEQRNNRANCDKYFNISCAISETLLMGESAVHGAPTLGKNA